MLVFLAQVQSLQQQLAAKFVQLEATETKLRDAQVRQL